MTLATFTEADVDKAIDTLHDALIVATNLADLAADEKSHLAHAHRAFNELHECLDALRRLWVD